jgi:uncharacterized SAM-binding protein YcdF (DUF218 family)
VFQRVTSGPTILNTLPTMLPPPKRFWRRWGVKLLLGGVTLLIVAAALAYCFPQQVLTVDSGPVTADVMVVLGGGATERPQRAAALFQQGEAPLIICSGSGDAPTYKDVLIQNGVPAPDVLVETNSRTTRENAEFTIPLLHALGTHRVIIVTSWFHSRRALACFEHYAPDLTFYSRPSYEGYRSRPDGEGQTMEGGSNVSVSVFQLSAFKAKQLADWREVQGYVKSEYWKLLGYWVCYGVWPI